MAIVNTNKLEVTKLDFHGIRDSLKTFLQGQTEFNDYDFDGSGLGAILDLLSYNTHYLAFYLNMVANEMFLDTASQRSSVVGIARQLGYTPKSARGALAAVNFTLTSSTGAASITVPKWTPFSITVEKDKFLFYAVEPKTITTISTSEGNVATFIRLPIKEGIYVKNTWTYNSQGKKQRFILDNQYIDTTTMSVTVKASRSTGTTDTYTLYKDLIALDSTSQVYFLQEVEDGKYEIYFGDGIYGKVLSDENVITVEYLTTNGSVANFAGKNDNESFSLLTTINDSNSTVTEASGVTIIGNGYAAGGTLPESLSSIKFNAPLSYAAQDRAVTANDYKNILLSNYGNIRGVKVWGGRPKVGMRYSGLQEKSGTVYICILPKHGDFLPRASKDYVLKSILAPYKILGIKNEIVDPKFVKLLITLEVIYNPTISDLPDANLKKKIIKSVIRYGMTDLDVFDGKFRHSILTSVVNDADPSVVAIKRMIVRFKIESRFNYTQIQSREPDWIDLSADEIFWDRVIFPNSDFGLSIEPSTQGGGVRTNTFYVWARSLANWANEYWPPLDDLPENVWMKHDEFFAWSMKRTDSGGKGTTKIHAGRFIECYFKDDGHGRINLYSVKGDTKIPYMHQQGSYKNSPELSWIEGQASVIGWDSVYDTVRKPEVRLVHRTTDDIKTSWFNPRILDYESWGSVNYELGRISSMKPIAILGVAGDIKFLKEGVITEIDENSFRTTEPGFRGIELERNIQSLDWFAFQYTGQDVSLGGYNAAGNNVMKLDEVYLTNNVRLFETSDKPSLQIGSRLSPTSSTEDIVRNIDGVKKPLALSQGDLNSAVADSLNIMTDAQPEVNLVIEKPVLDEEDEIDIQNTNEANDAIAIELSPEVVSKIVIDPTGQAWEVKTYSQIITDGIAMYLVSHGIDYVYSGAVYLPHDYYEIIKLPPPADESTASGDVSITNATAAIVTAGDNTTTGQVDVVIAKEENKVDPMEGSLLGESDGTTATPDKVASGKGKSANNKTIKIKKTNDPSGLIPVDSTKDPLGNTNPTVPGAGDADTLEIERVVHLPDEYTRDSYRAKPGNWVFYADFGPHGGWVDDGGNYGHPDGSVVLSDETMTKQNKPAKALVIAAGGDENNNKSDAYTPAGTLDYWEPITLANIGKAGRFMSSVCGSRWDLNNDLVIDMFDLVMYKKAASQMSRKAFQIGMGQEYGKDYGDLEATLIFKKGSC